MKVNRALNLVIPVEREKDTIYVHSTPIDDLVWDQHFLILSKAWSKLAAEGLSALVAPRVAHKMLKKVALATDVSREQPQGLWPEVERGLVNEIYRLTNVAVPSEKRGWETVGYYDARQRGLIPNDDADQIEGCLVFFTLASRMSPAGAAKRHLLDGAMSVWGARTEFLDCTAFVSSLTTSSAAENSGAKAES